MLPTVSILIPVYNRERLVRECIESAQSQTYPNIEIVVSDNASTDRTWEVVSEMARADTRIRTFRNESNLGPVRNWLRCVAEARGQYVKILFSDDQLAPEYLERLLPLLNDQDTAFAYSDAVVGETMTAPAVSLTKSAAEILPLRKYFALLAQGRVPFSPAAALFRADDVRKNLRDTFPTRIPRDYWRHGAGPDVMLFALTAIDYSNVACVAEPLVLFRTHAGSITVQNTGNEVVEGYRSTLSWFFANYGTRTIWTDYVARQWLSEINKHRRWTYLRDFTLAYEGTGNIAERLQVLGRALIIFPQKVIKTVVQRCRFS